MPGTTRFGVDYLVLPFGTGLYAMAAEGTYWRATNATPGTAIAQAVTAAFASTTPLVCIRNTAPAGGPTIYLDYLYLHMTIIPASATAWNLAVAIDPNARAPTGGTALVNRNVNTGFATASIATITVGPTSVAAAVAERLLTNRRVFNAIPVVDSVLVAAFGPQQSNVGQTLNGAVAVKLTEDLGPVGIAPGHTGLIHLWYPGNAVTGASYEVDLAWWERERT